MRQRHTGAMLITPCHAIRCYALPIDAMPDAAALMMLITPLMMLDAADAAARHFLSSATPIMLFAVTTRFRVR